MKVERVGGEGLRGRRGIAEKLKKQTTRKEEMQLEKGKRVNIVKTLCHTSLF